MAFVKLFASQSGLAAMLGFEQRVEQVVAPDVAHAEVVAQQSFGTESKFLDQPARSGVIRMDEGLHPVQAEFAKTEAEHRRDRLGRDALPLASGMDDIADGHALIADVAIMIVDKPKTTIGLRIGRCPEPII